MPVRPKGTYLPCFMMTPLQPWLQRSGCLPESTMWQMTSRYGSVPIPMHSQIPLA